MFNAPYQSNFQAAAENRTGLFVIGGNGATAPFGDPDLLEVNLILTVDEYNPLSDSWLERGRTLFPARESHFGWGFGPDGALIAGGNGAFDVNEQQLVTKMRNSVWLFIAPETWSVEQESLANPMINVATSVIDDVGYGYGGARAVADGSVRSRSVFAIRPRVATWRAASGTLPTGRDNMTAGTIGDKGYMAGGTFDQDTGGREVYQWEPVGESLSVATGALRWAVNRQAGGVVGDSLYLFGGSIRGGSGLSVINQRYTPGTDAVSVAHGNQPARRDSASFVYNDWIYMIGGSYIRTDPTLEPEFQAHANVKVMNRVERYDAVTDSWSVALGQPNQEGRRVTSPLVGDSPADRWSMSDPADSRRADALGLTI